MYQVTFVNLSPDAQQADANLGASEPTLVPANALATLLETFRNLDPVQNAEADPQIQLRADQARYVVRTTKGELLVQDLTDANRLTVRLTIAEILAELEGFAVFSRAPSSLLEIPAAPLVSARELSKTAPSNRSVARARWAFLSTAAALLLAGIVILDRSRARAPDPEFVPLSSSDVPSVVSAVTGVYVTGDGPGAHGLVVGSDGSLRIFELNATGAPNFVPAVWKPGRINGDLYIAVPVLNTYAKVVDRETLDYCGELYRRATAI